MAKFKRPEYRLPEKLAILDLDDAGFPGGEVEVSLRLPMALFEDIGTTPKRNLGKLRPLFVKWGLRGWNLTDHNGPIPATEDGMQRLEPIEQMAVITAWLRGVVDPPVPLPVTSSDGEQPAATSRRRSRGLSSKTNSSSGTPATP